MSVVNPPSSSNSPQPSILCPLSRAIMQDPVVDTHGHRFEKLRIEEWLLTHTSCPLSHKPISATELKPDLILKNRIQALRTLEVLDDGAEFDETSIPFPTGLQDDEMASTYLEIAKKLESKGQLLDAEQNFFTALNYTCKSEDYAFLPKLFEKKKEFKRACATYFKLAQLQMREGKKEAGLQTIKKCLELISIPIFKYKCAEFLRENELMPEASSLFLEIARQAYYHKQPENALNIATQAKAIFRGEVETWKMLACLQNNLVEGHKILLEAAQEPLLNPKQSKELTQWILMQDPENFAAHKLYSSLKTARLSTKISGLEKLLGEEIAILREEQRVGFQNQNITHWISQLWGTIHMQASQELVRIGAPAIPALINALFFKDYSDHKDKVRSYFGKDHVCVESGFDSVYYTLEQLANNPQIIPILKTLIKDLALRIQTKGLLLPSGKSSNGSPNRRLINLAEKIGVVTITNKNDYSSNNLIFQIL